ncbi:DciA family protein [Streptomyces sp. NPDC002746]
MTAHPAVHLEPDLTGALHADAAALPAAAPSSEAATEPVAGADLARIALRRAKADANDNPVKTKRKRAVAPRRATGADGRDPNPLGSIISELVVDNEWEGEASGADLKKEWPSLLGEPRATHWKAEKFDEETGTLRVLCESASWAANLRLLASEVITEVNEKFEQLQARTHQNTDQAKRRTSPLRRLDVQLRSGRPTVSPHDAAPPTPVTPAPVLHNERAVPPTAEYQQERTRQAEARAAAAGEPICPQPSGPPPPPTRSLSGDAPSAEYREQREQVRQARRATREQVLAVARNEHTAPASSAPKTYYTYPS